MNKLIIISLLIASTLCANYAVLVAGSNGYINYRHQSDVFHAYHILLNNGMPAENIIVLHMMILQITLKIQSETGAAINSTCKLFLR